MKAIVFICMAILFSGCVSQKNPPKVEYRINSMYESKKLNVLGCKNKVLKINKAFSPNYLMIKSMSYASGEFKQNIYSESQWSVDPSNAITREFLTNIRTHEIFKSVMIAKSRSKSDLTMEINIEDFLQYFDENANKSYVNALISLSLIDNKGNIVADKTFTSKMDVELLNAHGGVDGLNKVLNSILEQTTQWLSKVCK